MEIGGYRAWDGVPASPWRGCWAIVRSSLALILKRWVFWILIGLGLLNFLFNFAFVYLKATLTIQNEGLGRFLDSYRVTGSGEAYAEFMFLQATITALLLAFAGSTLIGADYRHGGMVFFLSRRIERRHYICAKLASVAAVVTLITTIPALVLYIEYGTLKSSLDYFLDSPRILFGILGYGAVLAVVQSLLLFAIAAWVPRTVPLVMSWLGVFVLLEALAESLRAINDNPRWRLLGFWDDMRRVGEWCFGTYEEGKIPSVPECVVVLALLCAACLALIVYRVRAIEVVR